jgi:hypothetical protein
MVEFGFLNRACVAQMLVFKLTSQINNPQSAILNPLGNLSAQTQTAR